MRWVSTIFVYIRINQLCVLVIPAMINLIMTLNTQDDWTRTQLMGPILKILLERDFFKQVWIQAAQYSGILLIKSRVLSQSRPDNKTLVYMLYSNRLLSLQMLLILYFHVLDNIRDQNQQKLINSVPKVFLHFKMKEQGSPEILFKISQMKMILTGEIIGNPMDLLSKIKTGSEQFEWAYRTLIRIHSQESLDKAKDLAEKALQEDQPVQVEDKMIHLAMLSHLKDYFASLLFTKEVKKATLRPYIPLILKLISKSDELVLMTIFSKFVFKGSDDLKILAQFYLGYCMTDSQTYEVSQPNFTGVRNMTRHLQSVIHQANTHTGGEIFIPLMDDWFFKPLLYIKKLDETNLQSLASNIFKFLNTIFTKDPLYAQDLTRLSKDEVVLLIAYLLTDDDLAFNRFVQTSMILFIQHHFFPLSNNHFRPQPFNIHACQSDYLLSKYRHMFFPDSLSSRLSVFLNQHSVDECPILLYVLMLCLQTRDRPGGEQARSVEFRKGVLSEIQEAYVCMVRVEGDHVKHPIDDNYRNRLV